MICLILTVMPFWIGLIVNDGVPHWETPGPFSTFKTVKDLALWACNMFGINMTCTSTSTSTSFCILNQGQWLSIPADTDFNSMMKEDKVIISCRSTNTSAKFLIQRA